MSDYYPDLDERACANFGVLIRLIEEDPTILISPNCPYPDSFIATMSDLLLSPGETDGTRATRRPNEHDRAMQESREKAEAYRKELIERAKTDDMDDAMYEDLNATLIDLKVYGSQLGPADQTEKMGYFRTKTALLEKLMLLRERAAGIKHVKEFESTILRIMEEVLTPEQRTEVMSDIRKVLNKAQADPLPDLISDEK